MSRTWNWPSREQWAARRQRPYWDWETGAPFANKIEHRLSAYTTPEEIHAAITHLEQLWRSHGRKMRELKLKGSPLYKQAGENDVAYIQRVSTMRNEDMRMATEPNDLKFYRHFIKKVLAALREDALPEWNDTMQSGDAAKALVAPFLERYDAAFKAAREEWECEMAATPVDDAAWEEELLRRRCVEEQAADDAAHPERFIHYV